MVSGRIAQLPPFPEPNDLTQLHHTQCDCVYMLFNIGRFLGLSRNRAWDFIILVSNCKRFFINNSFDSFSAVITFIAPTIHFVLRSTWIKFIFFFGLESFPFVASCEIKLLRLIMRTFLSELTDKVLMNYEKNFLKLKMVWSELENLSCLNTRKFK